MMSYKSYRLNVQSNCNIGIDCNIKVKVYWWDALRLALARQKVSFLESWRLWTTVLFLYWLLLIVTSDSDMSYTSCQCIIFSERITLSKEQDKDINQHNFLVLGL
jgi:hypothetical protein